jgi:hypothetical protein
MTLIIRILAVCLLLSLPACGQTPTLAEQLASVKSEIVRLQGEKAKAGAKLAAIDKALTAAIHRAADIEGEIAKAEAEAKAKAEAEAKAKAEAEAKAKAEAEAKAKAEAEAARAAIVKYLPSHATVGGGTKLAESGGIKYIDFYGKGSSAQFAVKRATAGTATLTVRYVNGEDPKRPLDVYVGGNKVATVDCARTKHWSDWTDASAAVDLSAGDNAVRLVATGWGPNVASLTVASAAAAPVPVDDLYVSPTGSDTNDGETARTAFKTMDRAAKALRPGVTVFLMDGTYSGTFAPTTGGTADKPILVRAFNMPAVDRGTDSSPLDDKWTCRVKFDGGSKVKQAIVLSKAPFVTVAGLEVTNYFSGYGPNECAVLPGADTGVEDTLIHRNVGGGLGFYQSHRASVKRVRSEYNGLDGLQGTSSQGIYAEDLTNLSNQQGSELWADEYAKNPGRFAFVPGTKRLRKNTGWESTKFSRMEDFTFVRLFSKANVGSSFWFDVGNRGGVVIDSTLDSTNYEIGHGPIVYRNCDIGWAGAWESTGVTYENCRIGTLQLRQGGPDRRGYSDATGKFVATDLLNITVKGCTIGLVHGTGDRIMADPTGIIAQRKITFEGNSYKLGTDAQDPAVFFRWGGVAYKDLATLTAKLGIEKTGTAKLVR